MLGFLRKKKNSPIILFLLVLIILVFIAFFGPTMDNIMTPRVFAAIVDGQVISDREFAQRYTTTYRQYQSQYREFDRKQAEQMKLREKVLDQMITSKLLAKDAEKRGLDVDDDALRTAILDNDSFKTDGNFDKDLYQRILNSAQLTPGSFEAYMREQLLQEKLALVVTNSVYVSSNEARLDWEADQRSMNLEFVRINTKGYEGQTGEVTPADVEEWKKSNADHEAQIQKHYTKFSRTKYNVPEKRRARHILVKTDKDMPHDLKKKAQQTIKDARAAVLDGKTDFAAAATKYSDDSTKSRGGDLGFFSRGQMVGPFEEAAFSMKPGEISPIVETQFGYHVIKLEEIQAPVMRKLEDVSSEIATELAKASRSKVLAKTRAQQIYAEMKGGKTLAEIITASAETPDLDPAPLKVEETGSFTQARNFIPKLGVQKELSLAAWKLTLANPMPPAPFETDDAWIIYHLKERTEPDEKEFASERGKTSARLGFQKRNNVLDPWADSIRVGANVEVHPLATSYDDEARQKARRPGGF